MRVCGTFSGCEDFRGRKQPAQTYSVRREILLAALLAIDHADSGFAYETGLAERLDGSREGASGGHDVLDEADALAGLEDAFDALRGAVVLRGLADEQEREARLERRGRRERN